MKRFILLTLLALFYFSAFSQDTTRTKAQYLNDLLNAGPITDVFVYAVGHTRAYSKGWLEDIHLKDNYLIFKNKSKGDFHFWDLSNIVLIVRHEGALHISISDRIRGE